MCLPKVIIARLILFLLALFPSTLQDIYLHNPRGSNNRLSENSRARRNGNRLFDSQNNNRGGYNVGVESLTYVEGSKLEVEWTNQHACGKGNGVHCEIIIQYLCGEDVRDGTDLKIIPVDGDEEATTKFGRHESSHYYRSCTKTKRNGGLEVADQRLRGPSARFTRQNPNGKRRGLECPEERDYYPYWRPTPWVTIAVLTNDVDRCELYRRASEETKWTCRVDDDILAELSEGVLPITREECEASIDKNGKRGEWHRENKKKAKPFVCRETEFSRDNHLGDVAGGRSMGFNWTIPSADQMAGNCVLRVRYNVSTGDYDAWNLNASTKVDVTKASGFSDPTEGRQRGFLLKNNPVVKIFDDLDLDLELAVNTAQYGRVFQDRSHVFKVAPREGIRADAVVHNVNVRGRRGNIVQVYPAVEYDYVPNTMMLPVGDYVHFQWTGSDTNPSGAGQGRSGTDRSNVILQRQCDFTHVNDSIVGHWAVNYPSSLNGKTHLFGLSRELRSALALSGDETPGSTLDDASAFFDLKPQKMTEAGVFHFFSTRNNDFSNRNQKGRLMVVAGDVAGNAIGSTGGRLLLRRAQVIVDAGSFDDIHEVRAEVLTDEEFDVKMRKSERKLVYDSISPFLVINPEVKMSAKEEGMRIFLETDHRAKGKRLKILYSRTDDLTIWNSLPFRLHSNSTVEFTSVRGGVFYIGDAGRQAGVKIGVIFGIIASIAFALGLGFYILKMKRNDYNNVPK